MALCQATAEESCDEAQDPSAIVQDNKKRGVTNYKTTCMASPL